MCRCAVAVAGLLLLGTAGPPASAAEPQEITIGYLGLAEPPEIPLSFLDPVVTDPGVPGARLGIEDDNTTGKFTRQHYSLFESVLMPAADLAAAFREMTAKGIRFVVSDLPAERLLEVAGLPEAKDVLIFNARAPDDRLRNADCRRNVLHTLPSRAMLADALAQYLMTRQWPRWLLVIGRHERDQLYAAAVRRAAERFGARIVAEKLWTFEAGNPRTDTGHAVLQKAIPAFTQARGYDVVVVADESNEFGEYFPYRTYEPRPVVGTQGLTPTAWSRVFEQWGAAQLQSRFLREAKRPMTERDYGAWAAVRSVGEAATRIRSADPAKIASFIRGPDFVLGAFKGVGVSYRDWDGQLRQPVPLAGPRVLVSVSPQEGYLHQSSQLDTLGYDRPDSSCRF